MEQEYAFFTPLYHSAICRLCGLENPQGVLIYDNKEEFDLAQIINRYLPITVKDDEKLPRSICPGCRIEVSSTMQFFNLIVEGQQRIRDLYAEEIKLERKQRNLKKSLENDEQIALITTDDANDQNFLIKIVPNEPFFAEDRELTLLVQGLQKPKRKPGRPRKLIKTETTEPPPTPVAAEEPEPPEEETLESPTDDSGGRNRLRRHRKIPQRFSEVVAGRELDKVLLEEGAIDEDDVNFLYKLQDEESVEKEVLDGEESSTIEVIGHLKTASGEIKAPVLSQLGARLSRRKKKKLKTKFECDFCNQTFLHRNKWVQHRAIHKGCAFHCTESSCFEVFSSLNKLKTHQEATNHTGSVIIRTDEETTGEDQEGPYFCEGCGAITTSSAEMLDHIQIEHPQLSEKVVKLDSSDFLTPKEEENLELPTEELTEKMDTEPVKKEDKEKRSYKCDICWRTFSHVASLVYHKESRHNNDIRFACNKCPKTFRHKLLLQRHQIVHSNLRPFSCKRCNLSFKTKSNLINHQIVHSGEKKHFCHLCDQSFLHKTSLTLHVQAHDGIRPHKCQVCGKSFTQFGNLNDHLRIHYGQKPFACNVCEKTFTTSSQQKLHSMRHTGERPWKCQYCGKRYLHKDTWRTHERRHTGEKPFQCEHCSKAFSEPWSLKKHTRLHTGEKPYKCDVCEKEFSDCSNLTKHKKVHLNATPKAGTKKTTEKNKPVENVYYLINEEEETEEPTVSFEQNPNGNWPVYMFTDEDGRPSKLPLLDGRTAEVLTLDSDKNLVHIRTNDNQHIFLQLTQQFENEDDILEYVKSSVMNMKPPETSSENVEESESPRTRNAKDKKNVPILPAPSEIQIDDFGRTFIYSVDGEERSLAADFPDGLNNVYFVAE